MADVIELYYQQLLEAAFESGATKIKVKSDFHGQMQQINKILSNDQTAFISTILEFMIAACNVNLTFNTDNDNYTKVFKKWQKELNTNLNIDIPRGLHSFSEQYYRERFSSSFIVLKGRWGQIDGVWMPTKMWLMDGASIYVVDPKKGFNNYRYYFGKPKADNSNEITDTEDEFVLIRKPYNKWTDTTPTPYLVKMGTLYHALFKQMVLVRQADIVGTAFPIGFLIKMGCEEAMRQKLMPSDTDLKATKEEFQKLRTDFNTHPHNRGFLGAVPFDFNFENIIPPYEKALDEKILKSSDKNLLSSLGLIEFKGFSSNREEAILNPRVLVERCEDAVLDYIELLDDVVALIKEKNNTEHRKTSSLNVRISAGIIKAFIDDKMRALIRNWYDRGLVAKPEALENTTPLNFETQVNLRDKEKKEKLDERMMPPAIQNLGQDTKEDVPDDKKKPNSQDYKNAQIDEKLEQTGKLLEMENAEKKNKLLDKLLGKTMDGYVVCENCGSEIDYENESEVGMGYIKCPICEQEIKQDGSLVTEYLEAPYSKPSQLPDSVKKNMTTELQRVFMSIVNNALKNGDSEEVAFKKAWSVISKIAHKNSKGKWVRNKKQQ